MYYAGRKSFHLQSLDDLSLGLVLDKDDVVTILARLSRPLTWRRLPRTS